MVFSLWTVFVVDTAEHKRAMVVVVVCLIILLCKTVIFRRPRGVRLSHFSQLLLHLIIGFFFFVRSSTYTDFGFLPLESISVCSFTCATTNLIIRRRVSDEPWK